LPDRQSRILQDRREYVVAILARIELDAGAAARD